MSWIALSDHAADRFSAGGLIGSDTAKPTELMSTGTIMIEAAVTTTRHRQCLFDFQSSLDWPFRITLSVEADQGVRLDLHQGRARASYSAAAQLSDAKNTLRMSYSWNISIGQAQLSIFDPNTGQLIVSQVDDPQPVLLSDIRHMIQNTQHRYTAPEVSFVAVSDEIEPIGPCSGIAANTLIETPSGPQEACALQPGEKVLTQSGENRDVLWVGKTVLPARGRSMPILLRAPYFGLSRDILVSADQHILASGSNVEYLFGQEGVLIAARHLIDGVSAIVRPEREVVTYYNILLDDHCMLTSGACRLESLFIRDIGLRPDALAQSILRNNTPAYIPYHGKSERVTLQKVEVATLRQLAAA